MMNEISEDLVFNLAQTAINHVHVFVSTSQWTKYHPRKIIKLKHSDNKSQVTNILAASLTGEFLAPHIIIKGKTKRFHPSEAVPAGWDFWYSDNHWTNKETMKGYMWRNSFSFLHENRATLKLDKTHPALTVFASFQRQNTPEFYSLMEKHIIFVHVQVTDKLQPLDISANKPIKDELK